MLRTGFWHMASCLHSGRGHRLSGLSDSGHRRNGDGRGRPCDGRGRRGRDGALLAVACLAFAVSFVVALWVLAVAERPFAAVVVAESALVEVAASEVVAAVEWRLVVVVGVLVALVA